MTDLESMFASLFTAPTKAVIEAEKHYRQIWIDWLNELIQLVGKAKGINANADEAAIIARQLDLAPVMKLDAKIEVGVTMRLASVRKFKGDVTLGLGVGTLQAAGSFGFSSESAQESVLQARAFYGLSNSGEVSLKNYLGDFSIPVSKVADLDAAVKFLGS